MDAIRLTDEERAILHAGVCRAHGDSVPGVYVCGPCETAGDKAVENIVTARLLAFAERERPAIVIEGVPPALRAAAMLPVETLGAAWDSNDFVLRVPPPWSYLRRFLNALADAVDSSTTPGVSS